MITTTLKLTCQIKPKIYRATVLLMLTLAACPYHSGNQDVLSTKRFLRNIMAWNEHGKCESGAKVNDRKWKLRLWRLQRFFIVKNIVLKCLLTPQSNLLQKPHPVTPAGDRLKPEESRVQGRGTREIPKAHKEHESFLMFRKSLPQWFIRASDQFFLCLHQLISCSCLPPLVSNKKTPATVVKFPMQSRFPNQPGQSAAVQNHRGCFTCTIMPPTRKIGSGSEVKTLRVDCCSYTQRGNAWLCDWFQPQMVGVFLHVRNEGKGQTCWTAFVDLTSSAVVERGQIFLNKPIQNKGRPTLPNPSRMNAGPPC